MSARLPSCELLPWPRPPPLLRDHSATGHRGRQSRSRISDVEAEVEDVTVLDDVVLAFQAQLAGIARARLTIQRHVVVVGNGFGPDEALLEVGVDHAGGFRRPGVTMHRPSPSLL